LDIEVMDRRSKAHLVGGGIGSLAAAAFLIRDVHMPGENITVYEALPLLGGSLDGAGNPEDGYSWRGGRMLTTDNYECTWELFKGIPSLITPGQSVYDETVALNERLKSHARARLIDRNRAILDVRSMGFSMTDRVELLALTAASEEDLGRTRITDWLSPEFFTCNFWYMWQTTFAFQPWHSALEFNRYLHRFLKEFVRIETLAGVKRTIYNQYDSLVCPLVAWLRARGVRFEMGCTVTDLGLERREGKLAVTSLTCQQASGTLSVPVGPSDVVLVQNASMTDASSLGSMTEAPPRITKAQSGGWALWEKLATIDAGFGKPEVFNSSIPESYWASFSVTSRDTRFFDQIEALTQNIAGTGGLVTFKDSAWLMSIVLPVQPHFANQPADVQVFWGYALHPDRIGDFVAKTMFDCNGAEILRELCGHLNFDLATMATANCIPCRMPYITSMFMPRGPGDRPLPVPKITTNLGFVSQFVEIPEDVVFTVEYSIRVAQRVVYELFGIDLVVPPVTRHDRSFKVQIDSLMKAFA
jgi:oleate hydratase